MTAGALLLAGPGLCSPFCISGGPEGAHAGWKVHRGDKFSFACCVEEPWGVLACRCQGSGQSWAGRPS